MQVFRSLDEIPAALGPTVAAIGNFDGVHRGHQAIIADVRARAAALQAASVAVTFDPHPVRLLRPEAAPRLITPLPERLDLLAATGLDATLVLPFTREFSQTPARDFAERVLARGLHAVEVHEGDSFRFGRGAEAGTPELVEFGKEMGFAVYGHRVLTVRGVPVSSSEVRRRIAAGEMGMARALLGRAFSVCSTQERGRGIGSRLLVPTINLAAYDELVPAHGVYVTRVRIGAGAAKRSFRAVTNCGVRPTFGVERFAIESYLLGWNPEADPVEITPETPVEVCFLQRLRDEQAFPSPEALKAQIMRDVAKAEHYHRLAERLG
ncbi:MULTISPECIES: bifunctional riboflavin kinase/FMN adenylyltransferase [Acidobacterium]|uniref:Riboflavin biosynthesis protein n=1 Tax=Acidobacterium capsulatum (strain ATCC 51196 / DSM 11244 / BCRC 80197 / JCM 7670 / NBRC 15755 / NCIMB 13165 / 161) TaxID=240015 RepID=C1F6C0_ACIC5|nr:MULTISPECIES: bifunctional riboflavin kinase/FMN adenylyltransferase [Acidobacterium]ACO34207.1 riboflavin biosynthesis protein RibF [Acidobacterium capsulatum ATCC 51196]HCT60711.1 bifunctional riboflavin kinase/FMN adenylyltransferase [Acidobacterium sp.]